MMFPKPSKPSQRERRRHELWEYAERRKRFLDEHRICQIGERCRTDKDGKTYYARATEVHHSVGRGRHLLDESTWVATCHACHMWAEAHPSEARRRGVTAFRNRNTPPGREP